jgi:choline dehydrogenase
MQDHLAMSYYYKATKPTLNNLLSPWWGKLKVGIQYVLGQKGPLSISVNQCGGFVKSSPDQAAPDMQLYCNPITYTLSSSGKSTHIIPDKFAGFILCYQPCRPLSRGSVEITSASMQDAPSIKPNYLSHPEDQKAAIRGGRLIQQLAQSAAIKGLIKAPIAPDCLAMTDEQLLEDFRQRASTCYHPVGTCVMGQSITTSVVSPQLNVHGIESLFVVDASVMPAVTSGNTHAPTTLIAHKGAQHILQLV